MNLPAWHIESEYPAISSDEFQRDEAQVRTLQTEIDNALREGDGWKNSVTALQALLARQRTALVLWHNLDAYVGCLKSLDASNAEANAKRSQLDALFSQLGQSFKPVQLLLSRCPEALFDSVFADRELSAAKFFWQQQRRLRPTLLSEAEEVVIAALMPSGLNAWSDLYASLSGTLRVELGPSGHDENIGIAECWGRTRSADEGQRKEAWTGLQTTWHEHRHAAAAILNALAGWRLELARKRSHTESVDYLTTPLFQNRIERKTLTTMLSVVDANKEAIQRGARAMAKLLGKNALSPWDLSAPAPVTKAPGGTPFAEGFEMIRSAFASVDPEFGEFAQMMLRTHGIESRVLPNKANGAHCTQFVKSNTPLVFQTYLGSNYDISTLAHELGHAFHYWTVREQSIEEKDYPMTLAETASIFAETVLCDELLARAKTPADTLDVAWTQAETALGLLLNIPTRFEFETAFYEKRKISTVSPDELSQLMRAAWRKWYGDTISETDDLFWATKLHFSMADTSFYNFPYTFGYLFALSIYGRREELGAAFWPTYKAILKDTGRMTAEDLVQKHFGEDIREPAFWQKAIDVVKRQLENFQQLFPS